MDNMYMTNNMKEDMTKSIRTPSTNSKYTVVHSLCFEVMFSVQFCHILSDLHHITELCRCVQQVVVVEQSVALWLFQWCTLVICFCRCSPRYNTWHVTGSLTTVCHVV